ncbi:ABC transporter permease [Roseivirga sp.]|uniref:ABC transporter permease n=1 Tax=Roseivirga sp. TaxID=1964215 RepID=UPI003B51F50C
MSLKGHIPPRLPLKFLRWFCKPELLEDIEGDIEEDFNKRYYKKGKRSATIAYYFDVLRFFRPFAIRSIFKTQNFNSMIGINTKIAFRNLGKHKLYSFINIAGLAIGIAACLMIAQYVSFQFSFENQNPLAESIYRVHTSTVQGGEVLNNSHYSGYNLGPALAEDTPEIERISEFHPFYGGAIVSMPEDVNKSFRESESEIVFVEPSFIHMFNLQFLEGNRESALNDPSSIVISKSLKEKYFGANYTDSVIGQELSVNGGWANGNFVISGVIEDYPENSHIGFNLLLPIATVMLDSQYQSDDAGWGWSNFLLYVQLNQNSSEAQVEAKIKDLMSNYVGETLESEGIAQELSLQNIKDIHLHSEVTGNDIAKTADPTSVYFMLIIAGFVLVIAWINFINLSTAKASERHTEVGVKKAMGALRGQLMSQFLVEAFWINTLALALSIGLVFFLAPKLESVVGQNISLDFSNPAILFTIAGLLVFGPILAGFYPAMVMSSFKTIQALRGIKSTKMGKRFDLRQSLVVFQFIISSLLVAGTFAVSNQLSFMQKMDKGIDTDQVLIVKGPEVDVTRLKVEAFKNEVKSISAVEHFSSSRSIPGAGYNWGTEVRASGTDQTQNKSIEITWVDEEFMDLYGLKTVAGRDFSSVVEGGPYGVIINEAAVEDHKLGSPEEAVGKHMIFGSDTVSIRGVMSNHNWKSMHENYSPAMFMYRPLSGDFFSFKVNELNLSETISQIESTYQERLPGNPMEYYFLDDFFNRQYESDKTFLSMFKIFALFTIIAACLGLLGLASFMVTQRSKEIGIRKVLGASSGNITLLFSRKYLFLIVIANVIAIPLAYFGIDQWLQNFAFHIDIGFKLFVSPMVLLLLIAGLTISAQTLKAAKLNPVKNLRNE